jgi:hypothetical protein
VVTLIIVFWLINRANEETLRLAHRQAMPASFYTPAPVGGTVVPAPLHTPLTPHVSDVQDTSATPTTGGSEPAAPSTRAAVYPEDVTGGESAEDLERADDSASQPNDAANDKQENA